LALDNGILEVTSAPGIKNGDSICLELPDFPPLKARVTAVVPRRSGVTCLKFSYSVEGECRDRMIVKLYTGNYSQDIHELDRPAIVGGVWKRAFGEAPAS
jgi:cellulose synthase (UDP-forming)